MTHLLQVALGPVQGFIATARRSRDLWFGSYILSELSKAAARSLQQQGAELVFPAPLAADDLEPGSDFLVANIVTAQADGADLSRARAMLDTARAAVAQRWRDLCDDALRELEPDFRSRDRARRIDLIRDDVWHSQVDDIVEFAAAAVPMPAGTTYRQANDRLRDMMARRKNTRWFAPYGEDARLPKSSLDGARSTVLREFSDSQAALDALVARHRAGIDPAEQLDTAGTVKRVVGRARGFVPVARVAAERWLQRAGKEQPALLDRLVLAYRALLDEGLATELKGKYRDLERHPEFGWVARFPFDAQLLYPERVEAEAGQMARVLGRDWERDRLGQVVANLRAAWAPLAKALGGGPQPYYGMLLADGDRMGELIDRASRQADGAAAHRRVSQALSAFAQGVPKVMASAGGACIYSGGDDVFGLVPLHRALDCADALRRAFAEVMSPVASAMQVVETARPTLSVGIAIVHMLEPLSQVRDLAHAAEALAKGRGPAAEGSPRNALGLIAKPRSGHAYACRIRWDDVPALKQLSDWVDQLDSGMLPGGLPHELEAVWSECARVVAPGGPESADFERLWKARVTVVLGKKRLVDGPALDDSVAAAVLAGIAVDAAGSRAALSRLLMARWLSAHAGEAQRAEPQPRVPVEAS
jgi:CRISPR-associated protein Cmr2